jgi:hypothetical protein
MFKRLFLVLILSLFFAYSYSQKDNDSLIFSKYSGISNSADTEYIILKVAENTPDNFLNRLALSSQRKLSDNIFIISKEVKNRLLLSEKFVLKSANADRRWKLSPNAAKMAEGKDRQRKLRYTIQFKNEESLNRFLNELSASHQEIKVLSANKMASFITTFNDVEKSLLANKDIVAIDLLMDKPKEELAITGFDLSANQLNLVHSKYPLMNGEGQHVSIKEENFDTADIDIKGRIESSPLASKNISNHANFMATIIAGAGNSVYYAKGAAWAATVSSSSFEGVLPDADSYYSEKKITVQNHSYGTSIDNNYGLNALAFDESSNKNESLLHVFSSGNSGADTTNDGNYANVPGFANITGNFKMAKNILVVGAVDSFGKAVAQSSAGPAYDGRLIPQIVAFQMNGTSESAALISGTALLLQQFYRTKNNSVLPSPLVKAILINSADDVYNPGPDYKTGFGNLNAMKAMNCINENKIFDGIIENGNTDSFQIIVPENISLLKITLAWNDPAASAFSPKALINDLDLQLALSSENKSWQPWVLNPFPGADSLNKPAVRKRDSLNNQEQITLDNPSPGNYTIKVKGYNIITQNQKYFIAYSFDSLHSFKWQRPAKEDFAEIKTETILKWQSSFTGSGTLEYRFISNENWQKIADINLAENNFKWTTPDTVAKVLLRMKIDKNYFYADTFLITTLLKPTTGFVCGDSILIYWNQIKSITNYEIFRLGEKYMQPFLKVADTFAIIKKSDLKNHFIAVSPVLDDQTIGTRSYAFDYTLQGSGCFINTFYVNLKDNNATLVLDLGTQNNIDQISFEKLSGSDYKTIFTTPVNGLEYSFEFTPLKTGISFFRAKIILKNGAIIYSAIESVTFVEPGKYLLLPVPVQKNLPVNLYTAIPDGEIITLIDAMGRIILKKEIQFTHEFIETRTMQRGQYFYQIFKKGIRVSSGKLIVL